MAPVPGQDKHIAFIKAEVGGNHVVVFTKSETESDSGRDSVLSLFKSLNILHKVIVVEKVEDGKGNGFLSVLVSYIGTPTLPAVFINKVYIGHHETVASLHEEKKLLNMINKDSVTYDYDLIVIGGGSGGLAASKEAADLGAKVALLDFVTPSPIGTTWGLGGTCVNVGCIPKKLMHQASILGHSIEDARMFGWNVPENIAHTWETMRENIQDYIGSLNWGYRVQLRTKSVNYLNSYGEMIDAHRIKATNKRGKVEEITGKFIIIAPGMRPRYPEIPGAKDFCITSDDLFSLSYCPGKTLVIGGSYVALECAGFLQSIGLDVSVMVRSIFLRGFDQQCANKVGEFMANSGCKIIRGFVPTKIERIEAGEPGRLRVHSKSTSDKSELVEEYNTVLLAIGRDACTKQIGLQNFGVKLNPVNGKLLCENEQSNVPHIYGVGDIIEGGHELTPFAIQQGKLLSRRLFGGSTIQTEPLLVPTTVFTPLEYGCCGYAEELAIEKYGEENIDVYHGNFWPLEWTVAKRDQNVCYAKLVCLIPEKEKVIGFHVLGPNAGEITQGYALAMKLGATKADFAACIGIHPTCAEIFTTMKVTKRSGLSVEASGC